MSITCHDDLTTTEIDEGDWNQSFAFIALGCFVNQNMCEVTIAEFTGTFRTKKMSKFTYQM